jgi:hypothetical protein
VGRDVTRGLVCCWLMGAFSLQAATGLIGSVTGMWVLPRDTRVEVVGESDTTRRFTGNLDSEGIFRFPEIPSGQYSIKITAGGFRELTLHAVTIEPGVLKDIGPLHLISPCEDTPNTVCAGSIGLLRMTDGFEKLEMIDSCAVDLHDPAAGCIVALGMREPSLPQDWREEEGFAFHTADGGVYLIPLDVSFSLNPSTVTDRHGCTNAPYLPGNIRIDSLPPGSRVCVLTRRGRYAELRLRDTIAPGQRRATVEYFLFASDQRPIF